MGRRRAAGQHARGGPAVESRGARGRSAVPRVGRRRPPAAGPRVRPRGIPARPGAAGPARCPRGRAGPARRERRRLSGRPARMAGGDPAHAGVSRDGALDAHPGAGGAPAHPAGDRRARARLRRPAASRRSSGSAGATRWADSPRWRAPCRRAGPRRWTHSEGCWTSCVPSATGTASWLRGGRSRRSRRGAASPTPSRIRLEAAQLYSSAGDMPSARRMLADLPQGGGAAGGISSGAAADAGGRADRRRQARRGVEPAGRAAADHRRRRVPRSAAAGRARMDSWGKPRPGGFHARSGQLDRRSRLAGADPALHRGHRGRRGGVQSRRALCG